MRVFSSRRSTTAPVMGRSRSAVAVDEISVAYTDAQVCFRRRHPTERSRTGGDGVAGARRAWFTASEGAVQQHDVAASAATPAAVVAGLTQLDGIEEQLGREHVEISVHALLVLRRDGFEPQPHDARAVSLRQL